MSLESTDIDVELERMAAEIRAIRSAASNVVAETNRASSTISQLPTNYAELISAVADLQGSTDPVDQLQIAKLAKINTEAAGVSVKITGVKAAIDQLGL